MRFRRCPSGHRKGVEGGGPKGVVGHTAHPATQGCPAASRPGGASPAAAWLRAIVHGARGAEGSAPFRWAPLGPPSAL